MYIHGFQDMPMKTHGSDLENQLTGSALTHLKLQLET